MSIPKFQLYDEPALGGQHYGYGPEVVVAGLVPADLADVHEKVDKMRSTRAAPKHSPVMTPCSKSLIRRWGYGCARGEVVSRTMLLGARGTEA